MERKSKYQKAKFFFKLNRLDLKILIGITEVPLNIGGGEVEEMVRTGLL